jgi:putative pyruvate formate lyase activating enzyme
MMNKFEPSYVKLHESGKLRETAGRLTAIYKSCVLCPRMCKVDRTAGEKGICSAGSRVTISSAHAHFGEEQPLVGRNGSGTIFLSHCNLLCLYCQNWDISHQGEGYEISDEDLAGEMLRLQKAGCHNINFVSPTHYAPNIVQAAVYAVEKGLRVPLVYNTGGYDRVEILAMLEGVFDIYMPDYKYSDGKIAERFSPGAGDYPGVAKAAIKEMHRQVGILRMDKSGVALRGLIIRHLVLPNDMAGTEEFVKFVAEEVDPGTYVNIMSQYHPVYKAHQFPEIGRTLRSMEYTRAILMAKNHGLHNLD